MAPPHARPHLSIALRRGGRVGYLIVLAAAALLMAPAAGARADTFVVQNTGDLGGGSLRKAITDANAAAGGAVDVVDATGVTGQIDLQTALPNLTGAFEIRGPGALELTFAAPPVSSGSSP